MRRLTVAITLLLMAGSAEAQNASVTFQPSPSGYTMFSMPSGNVDCVFTPAGGSKVYQPADGGPELSCDRREPTYVNITMTPRRIVRTDNPGEQGCCLADNPLPYGKTWSSGGFSCASTERGLVCKRTDGHGFSISREAVKQF
jgi:hypothetical protein